MLTPGAPPAPYLDRLLGWLAPTWQLKRLRARAALRLEAERADPTRTRWVDGQPWRRIDGPPSAPDRVHWEPLATPTLRPEAPARWRASTWWRRGDGPRNAPTR
jgi:hypothetical protein